MARIFSAVIVLLTIMFCIGLYNRVAVHKAADAAPPKSYQAPSAPDLPAVTVAQNVDTAAIIKRGRAMDRSLAEANKPKPLKDMVLIKKDDYQAARSELKSIAPDDPNYAEAQRLLASFDKHDAEGKELSKKLFDQALANDADGRRDYAREFERNALMTGLSVTVSTSGPKSTVFDLRYPALSKAAIYQLMNSSDLHYNLRKKGFLKLVVRDGYNWTGHVDLTPQK